MTYYSTTKGNDIRAEWSPLKATTLTAAKREAAKKEGGGYSHHKIVIAIGETYTDMDGSRVVDYMPVAERPMSGGEWVGKK